MNVIVPRGVLSRFLLICSSVYYKHELIRYRSQFLYVGDKFIAESELFALLFLCGMKAISDYYVNTQASIVQHNVDIFVRPDRNNWMKLKPYIIAIRNA